MDELDEDYLPLGSMQDALKVKLFLMIDYCMIIIKIDRWHKNLLL